jgi:hypothetical protein
MLTWFKWITNISEPHKRPYKYVVYYTCHVCKQITTFGVPSDINSRETVNKYTRLLIKLVEKDEHNIATKRILHEISPYMRRIELYLNPRNLEYLQEMENGRNQTN